MSAAFVGDGNPHWKGDDVQTYGGMHIRLRKVFRGRSCISCGSRRHVQVALLNTAPDIRHDERGRAFSTSTSDYVSLCASCHKRYDLGKLVLEAELEIAKRRLP